MHKAPPRVQLQKVLKSFGDWHAPIEAFMALAKCLRAIAQLACCCCSVAARRGVKNACSVVTNSCRRRSSLVKQDCMPYYSTATYLQENLEANRVGSMPVWYWLV